MVGNDVACQRKRRFNRRCYAVRELWTWSWKAENGKACVAVRYGSKVLELVKGKTAVEVGSNKELVAVLTTLRKAVEAGELDAQIEAVGAAMRRGFKR